MGNCVGSKSKKDPKNLTEEEINLLLQNTRLTRNQILALHQNFLKECPSGKLTQKDFVKLFKEVHPSENKKEKADKFCQYVFKVIDKENHGFISFQDFVLCFALTSDGDLKEKCEFAFKLYDLDKDGKISKKEMTQVLTALYDLSGIDDRKGDNSPEKKVNDIIKKINMTYHPVEAAPATPAASPSKEAPKKDAKKDAKKDDGKKEKADKKEKPAKEKKPAAEKPAKADKKAPASGKKEPKLPEFITKEQFIDACSSDEQLKKLFVDTIFANAGKTDIDAMINDNTPVTITTSTTVTTSAPSDSTRSTKTITVPSPKIELNVTKLDRDAHEAPIKHDDATTAAPVTLTTTINETVTKTVNSINNELDNLANSLSSENVKITTTTTTEETKTVHVSLTKSEEPAAAASEHVDHAPEVVLAAAAPEAHAAEEHKEEKKEEHHDEEVKH